SSWPRCDGSSCASSGAPQWPPPGHRPDSQSMFAIDHLRKTFRAPGNVTVNAVDDISLGVETGKLITLLGPSGCGKTTTLRCLAGLERPEAGKIVIANETMFDSAKRIFVSPSDRGLGMVFQ